MSRRRRDAVPYTDETNGGYHLTKEDAPPDQPAEDSSQKTAPPAVLLPTTEFVPPPLIRRGALVQLCAAQLANPNTAGIGVRMIVDRAEEVLREIDRRTK